MPLLVEHAVSVDQGDAMFGFFMKQIHDPVKQQLADLVQYPDVFAVRRGASLALPV